MTDQRETLQLLKLWHTGDRQALDVLIERHLPWVEQYVRHRLGPELRRAGDTQDFVQDAMIHVLEYGPKFVTEDDNQFRRLLARIVENSLCSKHRYICRLRRDQRREKGLGSDTVLSLDPPQKCVTKPDDRAEQNEKVAWIRLAIELLSPSEREILWLREMEGLTFPEVAKRIGTTEDAARMRFKRALPSLAIKVSELRGGKLASILDDPSDAP